MIHQLKILPEHFDDVISGRKTFEVRRNDRDFHVGDLLALNEHDGVFGFTGRSCLVRTDYILSDVKYCKPGYVILSIRPVCTCSPNMRKIPLATDRYVRREIYAET